MNRIRIIAAALLAAIAFGAVGCGTQASSAGSGAQGETSLATLSIEVSGMFCDGCVAAIEGTLARMPGVQECTVSLKDEVATVVADSTVTVELVIEAIEGIGDGQYTASPAGT